jgi:metal transporter CNNM
MLSTMHHRTPTPSEKKKPQNTIAAVQLLRRPHFLLVSLVLCNSLANTALPLFIDRLLNPLAALLISVTAILVFGEVMPQAICKRYGLEVGAYLSWLVYVLMIITFPISWPGGLLLDRILGEDVVVFRRAELKALVHIHAEKPREKEDQGSNQEAPKLTHEEVKVIQGTLDLAAKTAEHAITPLEKVFMLSTDDVITAALNRRIVDRGHSRMPVYAGANRQDIVGVLLAKDLLVIDETAGVTVDQTSIRDVPHVRMDIPLWDALRLFRTGRSHMVVLTQATAKQATAKQVPAEADASVAEPLAAKSGAPLYGIRRSADVRSVDEPEEVVGIMTMEDVLEELLQSEIIGEDDVWEVRLYLYDCVAHGRLYV